MVTFLNNFLVLSTTLLLSQWSLADYRDFTFCPEVTDAFQIESTGTSAFAIEITPAVPPEPGHPPIPHPFYYLYKQTLVDDSGIIQLFLHWNLLQSGALNISNEEIHYLALIANIEKIRQAHLSYRDIAQGLEIFFSQKRNQFREDSVALLQIIMEARENGTPLKDIQSKIGLFLWKYVDWLPIQVQTQIGHFSYLSGSYISYDSYESASITSVFSQLIENPKAYGTTSSLACVSLKDPFLFDQFLSSPDME